MRSWLLAEGVFNEHLFLNYVHIPWQFLTAPFFYMFLIYYLKIEKQSKNVLKWVLPFFLCLIIIRIFFVKFCINQEYDQLHYILRKYTYVEEIVSFVVSLWVFSYAYYLLKKKRDQFLYILSYDSLNWIHTFFKIGTFIYVFWMLALVITNVSSFKETIYYYFPLRVGTTVLTYWSAYQAFLQMRLIKERKKLRLQIQQEKKKVIEIDNDEKRTEVVSFNHIQNQILEKKHFTIPKISVESLAKELEITPMFLSNCLREHTGKNFNDYINELRVELAKQLLSDIAYEHYTITAIGLESGFNSRSTFFLRFKNKTGITPFEYQKRAL